MITLDFETRSEVDLRKCGVSVYARHASTHVLCLAWGRNAGDVKLWKPTDPPPQELLDAVSWGVETFEAHNAFFERNVWRWICHERLGWPDIKFGAWRCSAAAAGRLTFPRSLADVGSALGLSVTKDDAGHKVMLKLSKPKSGTKDKFDNDRLKFGLLYEYCKQDVRSEMAVAASLGTMPAAELDLWRIDQRINLRGLAVDRDALCDAIAVVAQTYEACCDKIAAITGGEVQTPKQVSEILKWIQCRTGKTLPNLTKECVSESLADPSLRDAHAILEIRQEASKSSTAKLGAMLARCDEDGRVRGNLVYHGAATGRWAGSGIQIQNFTRGTLSTSEIEIVHRLLPRRSGRGIDMVLGSPIDCISSSLRSMIRAEEGSRLLVCDFASIEARVLAWVAGQEDLLTQFAARVDVYKAMAAKIYDVDPGDVTKSQRQLGKVAILGLGFSMGHKAFVAACKTMAGAEIDLKFAREVVKTYRATNDRIAAFWGEVNSAAVRSIETLDRHQVGKLDITCDADWLRIRLPSGRHLHYRKPRLVDVLAPWADGFTGTIYGDERILSALESAGVEVGDRRSGCWVDCDVPKLSLPVITKSGVRHKLSKKEPQYIKQIEYLGVQSMSRKWGFIRTYGGRLVENLTQAIARDFLAEAMFRCEAANYPIVATVHDEIICELPENEGSLGEFENLMRAVPKWGTGCPIEVEGFESARYRK